jgi:hypothetical protein
MTILGGYRRRKREKAERRNALLTASLKLGVEQERRAAKLREAVTEAYSLWLVPDTPWDVLADELLRLADGDAEVLRAAIEGDPRFKTMTAADWRVTRFAGTDQSAMAGEDKSLYKFQVLLMINAGRIKTASDDRPFVQRLEEGRARVRGLRSPREPLSFGDDPP